MFKTLFWKWTMCNSHCWCSSKGLSVSTQTILNRFHEVRLRARQIATVVSLSARHSNARQAWVTSTVSQLDQKIALGIVHRMNPTFVNRWMTVIDRCGVLQDDDIFNPDHRALYRPHSGHNGMESHHVWTADSPCAKHW